MHFNNHARSENMSESNVKQKKPISVAQQRAVHKYVKNNYDRIDLTVPKGRKDVLKQQAILKGLSLNGFINHAIDEALKDEEFYYQLYEEYLADPDKDDFIDIEDYAKSVGITL